MYSFQLLQEENSMENVADKAKLWKLRGAAVCNRQLSSIFVILLYCE